MEISELKAELEKLHPTSFGWALSCCRRNHADAEEVLQTVYLKILQGKGDLSRRVETANVAVRSDSQDCDERASQTVVTIAYLDPHYYFGNSQ